MRVWQQPGPGDEPEAAERCLPQKRLPWCASSMRIKRHRLLIFAAPSISRMTLWRYVKEQKQ